MKQKVLVFGTSGHAKVVVDILKNNQLYEIVACLSLESPRNCSVLGIPTNLESELLNLKVKNGIVAIGDNFRRQKVVERILLEIPDFNFITAMHPSAIIGSKVEVGPGSVVMAGTVINAESLIGNHCIVNTTSSIDHDCILENFSSVAPGCTLGGNTKIGALTAIGLGANLIQGITIGTNSVIGASSNVTKDIPSDSLAYGNPCIRVRGRELGENYL